MAFPTLLANAEVYIVPGSWRPSSAVCSVAPLHDFPGLLRTTLTKDHCILP